MTRHWIPWVVAASLGGPISVAAQSVDAREAAASITEAGVRRWIDRIAHDSMLGRGTPSPALDATAELIAAEFRRLGLETTIQRYPLTRRRLIPERSRLTIAGAGATLGLPLTTDVAYLQGDVSDRPVGGALTILGGAIDPAAIAADSIRGRTVLWLADFSSEAAAARADGIGAALVKGGPALVLIAPSDTGMLVGARGAQVAERVSLIESGGASFPLLVVAEPAVARGRPDLAQLLPAIRGSLTTVLHPAAAVTATATLVDSTLGTTSAPNVIALVRGQGPLAGEYLAFSAHMDHVGISSGAAGDTVFNGADDNGSGTVGILELAGAFARGPRTGRSILLVAVSGEEKGLWGSGYFTRHPTVPISRIVADVNMDMIGRGWTDTVGVIGREHSDLGGILDQVAAGHPELRMTPVGDVWPTQGRFYRSDHYNFARAGIPILFLSSGYSPDYHQLTDSPDKIDAEKEARLVRLVYWFGRELATRRARPRWRPESYRSIVVPR